MKANRTTVHIRHCLGWRLAVAAVILVGVLPLSAQEPATTPRPSQDFRVTRLQLPNASGVVALDYFAYERRHARVWLPASNLGVVAVIDAATDKITTVGGFGTGEVELLGKRRLLGPTSVAIGEGAVYIGNRGDSSVCVVDAETLTLVGCKRIGDPAAGLARAPDAVVYVASTKELWITTGAPPLGIPAADNALLIMDAADPKHIKAKRTLALGASAEGYAVDNKRGLFYTNLEESGETVAIDVRRKKIVSRWRSGCAEPHGVALDEARRFLFVACADRVIALDVARNKVLGSINTGDGLDNIDYAPGERRLYAAASVAGTLTIAKVDDRGAMNPVATLATAKGARSVIAAEGATAYIIDPVSGSILKVIPN
jgi:DNA-binding beta-propeller fold protein YncE